MPQEYEMFKYILIAQGRFNEKQFEFHEDRRQYKLVGQCPFLQGKELETRCDIYAFRPVVCKLYPNAQDCVYSLSLKDNLNGEKP